MNKLISFRELIDLEPKPKKVKYGNHIYEYSGSHYYNCDRNDYLEENLYMKEMKEPNIEIIEEDVVIEHQRVIANLPFKNHIKNVMDMYLELEKQNYKINEIIDLLNKKGQGND